jgi:two-component system, OmpR family, phosphate regulon sensor histidine kinase PhoR
LRSQTIRLGIFISTLVIAAIVIFQLIWLNKLYHYEQKQFDHGIAKAIRGFYEDIHQSVDPTYNLTQLVSSPNSQTYFLRIQNKALPDSMLFYLQDELETEDIFTDCYVGLYNENQKKYTLKTVISAPTDSEKKVDSLPASHPNYDHIELYFPHRRQYILSLMNIWLIGSGALLFVLVIFGGSLFYFYKQTFLQELQKDFVNNFTHEFKTPVSVLNLAAEVLEKPDIVNKPERLFKYAGIVKYQSNYLQGQIERLLRQAFSESHQLHMHKTKVCMKKLVKEAIENLQPLIDEKKASVKCEFAEGLPGFPADYGYLMIVLTNLIENALKYSNDPKVKVSAYLENEFMVISVKDNGKGIERKYYNKIFHRFYRVSNGEEVSARGFGLGLSFSKKIIDAHHGKINVESIPDIGSNFILKLPLT